MRCHAICKRRSIGTKERKIAMKRQRQLEPEGTMSMRRERDRLSKARHRSLESELEALLTQVFSSKFWREIALARTSGVRGGACNEPVICRGEVSMLPIQRVG